ncbi:MAG: gamma-glutamyltransferase, partial [SAR202 cluster bacterium]|nr:gamma-glutamyltransferase [SAR202 cluster bacterium]
MPGMIVAPQPPAVEAGARVLAAGGNAFDAALACAWVQFLVDPHSCGVGGYILLTCHPAGSTSPAPILDAPALAGSLTTPGMWEDRVIGPNPSGWGFFLEGRVNEDGFLSVCTPGTIRGLAAMHERWCTRPWADLIQPGIAIAENGWPVSSTMAHRWKEKPQFFEGSSLFMKL